MVTIGAVLTLLSAASPTDTIAIRFFESVAWGESRATVERVHGSDHPVTEPWGTSLSYYTTKLGVTAIVTFRIDRIRGLVSGSYTVPIPRNYEQGCEDLFLGFRRLLVAQYGEPTSDSPAGVGRLKYCEGVEAGDTGSRAVWNDDEAASITIRIRGAAVVVEFDSGNRAPPLSS